ncbi:putative low complexity protein [Acanthamoeba polyphaga moumouvirus]|uniref:Uncharacterized protein n=2 Tax=Moumouvirus TaxID=3080801 RepID=H2EE83_9VIRU|nr:putative low complexity protein [Acanthamoeba polyphaga moumouvirus]AEX62706.1 hypothetical protein mv_R501 [Moumouvirus Monve]AGC02015.1 putative low complexity protein [Acanthamoeba polyphaga moumouvirus]AQN68383.1 putative low complexity protein [Saudi moumouvirus]
MTHGSKNRPTYGRPYPVHKNDDNCHCKSNNFFNFPNFNNNNVFPDFINKAPFNWANNDNFCNFSPFQQQQNSHPVVYHKHPEKHHHHHHHHYHKAKPAQKNCHC